MEKNTFRTQLNAALIYGSFTGFVYVLYVILFRNLRQDFVSHNFDFIAYLIPIAGMAYGIKYFRDKKNGGYLTFGKAFSTGLLIAIVMGAIYAIYCFIYMKFIDKTYIAFYLEQRQQELVARGMSNEQIDSQLRIEKTIGTPIIASLLTFLGNLLIDSIILLIISLFLKKNKPKTLVETTS
jgi:hypothetical protein